MLSKAYSFFNALVVALSSSALCCGGTCNKEDGQGGHGTATLVDLKLVTVNHHALPTETLEREKEKSSGEFMVNKEVAIYVYP